MIICHIWKNSLNVHEKLFMISSHCIAASLNSIQIITKLMKEGTEPKRNQPATTTHRNDGTVRKEERFEEKKGWSDQWQDENSRYNKTTTIISMIAQWIHRKSAACSISNECIDWNIHCIQLHWYAAAHRDTFPGLHVTMLVIDSHR